MSSPHPPGGIRRACTCGRLLGIQHGTALHIKRHDFQAVVHGAIRVLCTRCRRETAFVPTSP